MATSINSEIEYDRRLLDFETYEEYLDSLVTPVDLLYLQSTSAARQVARLGYRFTGKTYDEETFYRRRNAVKNVYFPENKMHMFASKVESFKDAFQQELATRERGNRLRLVSTIIFLRVMGTRKSVISVYIDFEDRLRSDDWGPFFQGKAKLRPRKTDLSYYNWGTRRGFNNSSSNYDTYIDPNKGLVFKNLQDGKIVNINPWVSTYSGTEATRLRIHSDDYIDVVLYDHVLRGKI